MKRGLKVGAIIIALILSAILSFYLALAIGYHRRAERLDMVLPTNEEVYYYYYSEDMNAYFTWVLGSRCYCGQMVIDGAVQDIFFYTYVLESDNATMNQVEIALHFQDGCYVFNNDYDIEIEKKIFDGKIKYVSNGLELKIKESDLLKKKDYPRTIRFVRYLKDDIDLFEKGFTKVYDCDYATGVITITGIDGIVETYERASVP